MTNRLDRDKSFFIVYSFLLCNFACSLLDHTQLIDANARKSEGCFSMIEDFPMHKRFPGFRVAIFSIHFNTNTQSIVVKTSIAI